MFNVREATADDFALIVDAWLTSCRNLEPWRWVDGKTYFDRHRVLVNTLIQHDKGLVACDPDEPSVVYGFVVYELTERIAVIDYVYVKKDFRGFGIAKELIKRAIDGRPDVRHVQLPVRRPGEDRTAALTRLTCSSNTFDPYLAHRNEYLDKRNA